ncbi:MAG: MFS transporter [Clostridia bacterium]|nr:MFS transporter [Clostridia bacterium]
MKLNYKRTFFVGTAFFLICLFWQTYDAIIPKILTDKFGMSQFWSGAIMAFDNILALFMLPLFGAISDKHKGKRGKRTPFIVFGTIVAAIAFLGLSVVDNIQLSKIDDIAAVTDSASEGYESAMETLYDSDVEITVDGKEAPLSSFIEKESFLALEDSSDEYASLVVPARQAYAAQVTSNNGIILIAFIAMLLVVLVAMATFRSPAVALMPDVTLKPLRSKANAIINLMGSAGGILILIAGIIFGTGKASNALMNYIPVFAVTSVLMLLALAVFLFKVKEPQFVAEMRAESERLGLEETDENVGGDRKLTGAEMRSLIFILISVVFWFMGYNAVTSKYSVYASNVLRLDFNLTLIIAQAAAIIAFIPVGMLASKIGRKKSILIGVALLGSALVAASFIEAGCNIWVVNLLFTMAGIGWATINVNSYPMVVEMSKGSNIGRYTGYYYTASMAAQTVTPIISGKLLDSVGMRTLFPYAAIFVFLAFITMLFVKHGDNRPPRGASKLESLDVDV